MSEYLINLIVENYGPVGVFAALLWLRQSRIIDAIGDLAEQHEDVDADRIEDKMRIRGD